MKKTVILFAKAPRFGCVKTRLAKDIGPMNALRFYRNTLNSVANRLRAIGRFNIVIAATPDIALSQGGFAPMRGFTMIPQGMGDLGVRMRRAFRQASHGPALIIGSDIPEIYPCHIDQAFRALGDHDAVFGPCSDGGYWLIGLKNPNRIPPNCMKNVRWSTNTALNDTLLTLPKQFKVSYINQLEDIDDGVDYAKWKAVVKTQKM